MEGLFKLIFYIIIITFWVISNMKKRGKWEEKIPDFPKQPSLPQRGRVMPKPVEPEPLREGPLAKLVESSADETVPSPSMTFDELLRLRRKQTLEIRDKKKVKKIVEPVVPLKPTLKDKEKTKPVVPVPTIEEKPAFRLDSSIKDGIIWSVILGPPRSKERFDWKNPPTGR